MSIIVEHSDEYIILKRQEEIKFLETRLSELRKLEYERLKKIQDEEDEKKKETLYKKQLYCGHKNMSSRVRHCPGAEYDGDIVKSCKDCNKYWIE